MCKAGKGQTTINFETTKPVYASPVDLVPPDSSIESPDVIGVTLPSTLNFDSSSSLTVTGSDCATGSGPSTPVDCGKKKSELDLFVFSPAGDLVRLKNAGDNPADPYKNCPNGSGRPRAQVGRQHRTVNMPLTGSVIGTISYTITLDWTLKLERPPKKGKSPDIGTAALVAAARTHPPPAPAESNRAMPLPPSAAACGRRERGRPFRLARCSVAGALNWG